MGPWRNQCRVPWRRVNPSVVIYQTGLIILRGSALPVAGRGLSVHERHQMLLERSDLIQKGLDRLAERSTKSTYRSIITTSAIHQSTEHRKVSLSNSL